MKYLFMSLYACFCVGIGACTITYYAAAYFKPVLFWENPRLLRPSKGHWKLIVLSFGAMIGTCVCIYGGAMKSLGWMPRSWQLWSDEGPPLWAAELIAWFIAGNAGILLVFGASQMASRLVELELQIETQRIAARHESE